MAISITAIICAIAAVALVAGLIVALVARLMKKKKDAKKSTPLAPLEPPTEGDEGLIPLEFLPPAFEHGDEIGNLCARLRLTTATLLRTKTAQEDIKCDSRLVPTPYDLGNLACPKDKNTEEYYREVGKDVLGRIQNLVEYYYALFNKLRTNFADYKLSGEEYPAYVNLYNLLYNFCAYLPYGLQDIKKLDADNEVHLKYFGEALVKGKSCLQGMQQPQAGPIIKKALLQIRRLINQIVIDNNLYDKKGYEEFLRQQHGKAKK
jgi:hypothetical protein